MPRTALLVCDFQEAIRALVPENMKETFETALARASSLLAFARQRPETIVAIHVIAGGGRKTDSSQYSVVQDSMIGKMMASFPVSLENPAICDAVTPLATEKVYSRPRVSPFHDTSLNADLRALAVEDLILCGVATSGVVLATFRSAIDADYNVVVVRDACADRTAEMHDVLMEKYFGNRFGIGSCMTAEEVMEKC